MDYVDDLKFKDDLSKLDPDEMAKAILKRKLKLWSHEKKYRAFKRGNCFIEVEVKELIFGVHADPKQTEIIKEVAKKLCPNKQVKTMERENLEIGEVEANEI